MSRDKDVVWIYRRKDHTWEWRRVEEHSNIVSTSGGQGYEHEDECVAMARALNPDVPVKHFPTGEDG